MTLDYEAQLEAWLGQGNLDFTNIFTKAPGNTSLAFHAAADGRGATFTLMSVSGVGFSVLIIGGYNPWNWSRNDQYNMTENDADRTSFIYSLSTTTIQRQNLGNQGASVGSKPWNSGEFATYNSSQYGPAWGAGHDLYAGSNLIFGGAFNFSYGGGSYAADIVDGAVNGYSTAFTIGAFEVYTVAPGSNSVPDAASTCGLIAVALTGLSPLRRRFSRA